MQAPVSGPAPPGIIYNTAMNRPDAALALCAAYGFEGKREARLGAICVVGAGLNTAIFCDMVGRFYMLGPPRNTNSVLPVGLAAVDPLPADPEMVRHAVERRNQVGEPLYARGIERLSDTSVAEAVLRNGVTFNAESVVVLSAPATYLAKSLDLPGVQDLYRERVSRLVIVDSGAPRRDTPALRRILAEWPTPIFFCGREVGEALPFPGSRIETDFSWAPAHPVVDAYRAFKPMPYDAPSYDLAAVHYAVHPNLGFFRLSEPGSISVSDDGGMEFSTDVAGGVRSLIVEPGQKDKAIEALVEVACAEPVPPPERRRRPAAAAQAPPPPAAEAPKPPENKQE